MSVLRVALLSCLTSMVLLGCVVEERPVRHPRPCAGGVWVAGHYGPRGHWHPGHWRCPGVVEVVEVD
jgi:hypothetical protein